MVADVPNYAFEVVTGVDINQSVFIGQFESERFICGHPKRCHLIVQRVRVPKKIVLEIGQPFFETLSPVMLCAPLPMIDGDNKLDFLLTTKPASRLPFP